MEASKAFNGTSPAVTLKKAGPDLEVVPAEGVAGPKVQKAGDTMGGGLEKGSIGSKPESMTGEQKK